MCVIIDKPAGITMPDEMVMAAAEKNPDGWGVMWINPADGKMKSKKGLFTSRYLAGSEFLKLYNQFKNIHAIFHLRVRTHGRISEENCHPFQICNEEEHGTDLMFMHNGTITCVDDKVNPDGKSDTNFFNEQFLIPVLRGNPEAIFLEPMQVMIDSIIGASRLLFLNGDGRIVRLGRWHEHEGHIVSNTHSFEVSRYRQNFRDDSWWEKEEQWYSERYSDYKSRPNTDSCNTGTAQKAEGDKTTTLPLALPPSTATASTNASTDKTLEVLKETVGKSRAEDVATQIKMNFNKARSEDVLPQADDPYDDVEDDDGGVTEMPYDAWIKNSSIKDMVPVGARAVKADYLTTDDMMQMDSADIEDFVHDYPERTHELLMELLGFMEYYGSGIHSMGSNYCG